MPNFNWMCSLCQLLVAKNHNFWQILTFWGLQYRPPFTDQGQIRRATADPQCMLKCQISSQLVYSLALSWWKTPIFAGFWTSAFSGVNNWQQSEKVKHRCTTTNLPLSNGIKIVSVLQRFHGESGRAISNVQKRDEQIDKHKKTQRFWPPWWRVKSESHQTWHGILTANTSWNGVQTLQIL